VWKTSQCAPNPHRRLARRANGLLEPAPSANPNATTVIQFHRVVDSHRTTSITDDGLRYLTAMKNLTILDISDTGVTDEGLQHLERMPSLLFLQAHRTKITKEGVSKLEQSLPNVDVYYEHP
jgi:hypothetical protein